MLPFRAGKQTSQESFFILLADGTGSMRAHYPIFLKCFNDVFRDIKYKLTFQFGNPEKGSDNILYNIQNYLESTESNFNKVFKQLFDILLTQHRDKKYLTICFLSDGEETFEFEELLPIVEKVKSVFQIQFASIAVGKQFPTLISNKLRSLLHNNGNLEFKYLYEILGQDEIQYNYENENNSIMLPISSEKLTQQFTEAFESLKQQLIVYTDEIELNEIVYKSFIEDQRQETKVVKSNQLFLARNTVVSTKNNDIIEFSRNLDDLKQIQQGSIQEILIELQASDKLQNGKHIFKKLYKDSIESQRLLKNKLKQNKQVNNTQEQEMLKEQQLNSLNKLAYMLAETDYLASLKDKEHEYAQLQAQFEKNPLQQIEVIEQFHYKAKDIIIQQIEQQPIEQCFQKKQRIKNFQNYNRVIKKNSKLIILIDTFQISGELIEEIINQKNAIFNNFEQENIVTFWWEDILKQSRTENYINPQMPLAQAILQILSFIEQDQSGINNFTISLIMSGLHQVSFEVLRNKLEQISQQNKSIALTTLIIQNEEKDTLSSQQKLSQDLRRQLHTNENHSLQVSMRMMKQELIQYLPLYFRMIKEFQNKFFRLSPKVGCFIKGVKKEKNAQLLFNQIIRELQQNFLKESENKDLIINAKYIKEKYYTILKSYKEREMQSEKYYLSKLNTLFELIDKINQKNYSIQIDNILKISLDSYSDQYENLDGNQLIKARRIFKTKEKSNIEWIGKTAAILIGIPLIALLIKKTYK